MSEIHETKNYSIFKLNAANAVIKKEHVDRLKASIKLKNMLHLRPILVNSEMEIIDGQHRFTAAKELNVAVFYEMDSSLNEDDMALLNSNSRTWSNSDFVHHFQNRGKKDYQMLNDFCKKHELVMTQALHILGQQGGRSAGGIKSGMYKFPGKEIIEKAEQHLWMLGAVQEAIRNKSLSAPAFISKIGFFRGCMAIFAHENFSLDLFIKKIELHIDKIQKRADATGYYNMLKDIYNWKNSHPLE